MSFISLVKKRRSIRGYEDTPVSFDTIKRILETVRFAPSACNLQPWHFIVIRDEANRKKLSSVYPKPWFINAPVIIAACCDHAVSWKRNGTKDFGEIDVAIALDHLTLAAAEEGLGTCWIGAFNFDEAIMQLGLPEHITPVAFTPLGYPLEQAAPEKIRKSVDSLVHYEKFGAK